MKRVFSGIFAFALALVLLGGASFTGNTAYAKEAIDYTEAAADDSAVPTSAEQTQWYYDTVGGVRYKRLWSVTNRVWLSDWMLA